ncbi:methylated-DNA--[protein]-cysteine S-methyltransferase [Rhodococcus sp. CSLK01-03]|uniref:Methylated-DNA--[protein]-cysteine S-methyltransferase n=1 Tax=Rhodococcus indonesiensis TaxID=3055869 RepID=A0ABT7RUH9_9NOCA|nr:methylated-DNA--[protein]-cysteine S-methyltransferase [Rhodococcus indonesiensis]MDM7490874.1 methylated-DNA--[protein]-cysteine S-methyltransferase [Rhodococcus indonesiensis]
MTTLGYTLFDTAVGTCGLVWSAAGVVGVQLPDTAPEPTRDELLGRFPAAVERPVPAAVQPVIDAVTAHLAGAPDDLRWVPIDYRNVSEFDTAVYEFARTVEPGAVATYGEVALRVGRPGGAQAVGQALGRNPVPVIVPCHRILAAGGGIGGFSAPGSTVTKRELLALEHAPGFDEPTLF